MVPDEDSVCRNVVVAAVATLVGVAAAGRVAAQAPTPPPTTTTTTATVTITRRLVNRTLSNRSLSSRSRFLSSTRILFLPWRDPRSGVPTCVSVC